MCKGPPERAEASDAVRSSDRGSERGRRRRWLMAGGLLVAATAATCVWPWVRGQRYLTAARRALEVGDLESALTLLGAAETRQPASGEVQYVLAVANRRAGRLDRFRVHLRQAKERRWPAADLERQEWLATAQVGDVEAVRGRLLALAERGAGDGQAEEICEALTRGCLAAYRLREAWKYLEMWLQWRPEDPQAHLLRAYVHEQLEQLPLAVEDYRATLAQLPNHRDAHFKLAELLYQQGTLDEAEAHFQACVDSDASDVDALIGTARCAVRRGSAAAAQLALDAASSLPLTTAQRANVLAERGRARLQEGQIRDAVEILSQAVELAPAELTIQLSLATALARSGQPEQAKLHHERLRQITARRNRLGDITRALVANPNDADLRCEAGTILIELGLAVEGVGWLKTALACVPIHPGSHRALADYYAVSGNQRLSAVHRSAAETAARQPIGEAPTKEVTP